MFLSGHNEDPKTYLLRFSSGSLRYKTPNYLPLGSVVIIFLENNSFIIFIYLKKLFAIPNGMQYPSSPTKD